MIEEAKWNEVRQLLIMLKYKTLALHIVDNDPTVVLEAIFYVIFFDRVDVDLSSPNEIWIELVTDRTLSGKLEQYNKSLSDQNIHYLLFNTDIGVLDGNVIKLKHKLHVMFYGKKIHTSLKYIKKVYKLYGTLFVFIVILFITFEDKLIDIGMKSTIISIISKTFNLLLGID